MDTLLWTAIALFLIYRGWRWYQSNQPEKKIEHLETIAESRKNYALNDTMKLGKEIHAFVLEATERDYMRLKERNKHDMRKRVQLAQDWLTYTEAVMELSSARDMLHVDMGDDAYDTFGQSVREPHIKRQEVERRFQEALGEKFEDRWEQFTKKNPSPFDIDLDDEKEPKSPNSEGSKRVR